jgi:LEA14-like dessication related protein
VAKKAVQDGQHEAETAYIFNHTDVAKKAVQDGQHEAEVAFIFDRSSAHRRPVDDEEHETEVAWIFNTSHTAEVHLGDNAALVKRKKALKPMLAAVPGSQNKHLTKAKKHIAARSDMRPIHVREQMLSAYYTHPQKAAPNHANTSAPTHVKFLQPIGVQQQQHGTTAPTHLAFLQPAGSVNGSTTVAPSLLGYLLQRNGANRTEAPSHYKYMHPSGAEQSSGSRASSASSQSKKKSKPSSCPCAATKLSRGLSASMTKVVTEVRGELMKRLKRAKSQSMMQKVLHKALQRLHQCPCESWRQVELKYLKHKIVVDVTTSSSSSAVSKRLSKDIHLLKALSSHDWDMSIPTVLSNVKQALLKASQPGALRSTDLSRLKAKQTKLGSTNSNRVTKLRNTNPNRVAIGGLAAHLQSDEVLQDAERNLKALKLTPEDETVRLMPRHHMVQLHNEHLEERKQLEPSQVLQDAERNLKALKLTPEDETVRLMPRHHMVQLHNEHLEERKKQNRQLRLHSTIGSHAQRLSQLHDQHSH